MNCVPSRRKSLGISAISFSCSDMIVEWEGLSSRGRKDFPSPELRDDDRKRSDEFPTMLQMNPQQTLWGRICVRPEL